MFSIILHQRIESVRSLRFKWKIQNPPLDSQEHFSFEYRDEVDHRLERWTKAWDNIASIQNLRDLHIKLGVPQRDWRNIDEETVDLIFRPVKKVVRPDLCVLTISFPPMDRFYQYFIEGDEWHEDDTSFDD